MKRALLLSCVALFAVACGGLDDDKKLSDLDDSEITSLCSDAKAETTDCGNGVKVTTATNAECEASAKKIPDSCTATVGDYNECDSVDPCKKTENAACGRVIACALGGGE